MTLDEAMSLISDGEPINLEEEHEFMGMVTSLISSLGGGPARTYAVAVAIPELLRMGFEMAMEEAGSPEEVQATELRLEALKTIGNHIGESYVASQEALRIRQKLGGLA